MGLSCSKKIICIIISKNSTHHGGFYCLNCLYSFKIECKLKFHEEVCKKKKIFVELQFQQKRIMYSKFSQYVKSDKMRYIIFADVEYLIKKIVNEKEMHY